MLQAPSSNDPVLSEAIPLCQPPQDSDGKIDLSLLEENLRLKTNLGIVDCLGEVLGGGDSDEVPKHSIEMELSFGKCRVLDTDALLKAKETLDRDRDQLAVRHLKEIRSEQARFKQIWLFS